MFFSQSPFSKFLFTVEAPRTIEAYSAFPLLYSMRAFRISLPCTSSIRKDKYWEWIFSIICPVASVAFFSKFLYPFRILFFLLIPSSASDSAFPVKFLSSLVSASKFLVEPYTSFIAAFSVFWCSFNLEISFSRTFFEFIGIGKIVGPHVCLFIPHESVILA